MKHIQKWVQYVALGAFALSMVAATSTAHANIKICNGHPSQLIWFTMIVSDSTCSGHGNMRETGWWSFNPGECKVVSSVNMTGKILEDFAITNDGSVTWQGPVQNNFWTPTAAHSACFTDTQLQCTNAGSNCFQRRYGKQTINGTNVTITYSP